jgi:hypothetical protein
MPTMSVGLGLQCWDGANIVCMRQSTVSKYLDLQVCFKDGGVLWFSSYNRQSGAVAHSCNPSYLGGKNQEDHNLKSTQAKILETPCQPMAGYGDGPCHPQLCQEAQIGGSRSGQPGHKARNCNTLISNPRTTKKRLCNRSHWYKSQ